jgi:hypothetical protein
MDILIDNILQAVQQLGREKPGMGLTPQQAARQRAMQERLAAMHRAAITNQARVQPKRAVPAPVAAKPAAPVRPAIAQQPLRRVAPAPAPEGTLVATRPAASRFLVPLIIGEVLAPPLALREPEL